MNHLSLLALLSLIVHIGAAALFPPLMAFVASPSPSIAWSGPTRTRAPAATWW